MVKNFNIMDQLRFWGSYDSVCSQILLKCIAVENSVVVLQDFIINKFSLSSGYGSVFCHLNFLMTSLF